MWRRPAAYRDFRQIAIEPLRVAAQAGGRPCSGLPYGRVRLKGGELRGDAIFSKQTWRRRAATASRPAVPVWVPTPEFRNIVWLRPQKVRACMVFLSFVYRFLTNFAFMAVVYFSLNFMEKYPNRAILAILVLVYAAMRAASTLRAFYFFQKIERLEAETKRLQAPINDGSGGTSARKQVIADVARLRRDGELKSYMDLFFLALIVLLCVAAIMRQ
jgi:hypothetical protein